jgi:rfaE bifunctional protein nucleotidyltransferase chain/domain
MRSLTKVNIVLTIGVYDLFHVGHLRLLKKASLLGDKLFVGVVNDSAVKKFKGENKPLIKENDRLEIISSLPFVDDAMIIKEFNPIELVKNLSKYDNLIYVRGEDQFHIELKDIEKFNPVIVTIERTKGVSSSDIIKKLGEKDDCNK